MAAPNVLVNNDVNQRKRFAASIKLNPTNGSWWIHSVPFYTTAVGGISELFYKDA